PNRERRWYVHDLLRRVELYRRALRILHRNASVPRGHGPAAIAGSDFVSAARNTGPRQVPARSWLHDRRVRQEPSWRSPGFPTDGAWLPGVLGLPLSPGCDAAGELPGHQQEPDRTNRCAAVHNNSDPWGPEPTGRCGPEDRHLHDPAAPYPLDEVSRRHGQEPDGQG